jgi:hypothetical protein
MQFAGFPRNLIDREQVIRPREKPEAHDRRNK